MGTLFLQPCERDGVEETNSGAEITFPLLLKILWRPTEFPNGDVLTWKVS